VYREFGIKTLEKGDVGILGEKHKDDFEAYWQDETGCRPRLEGGYISKRTHDED
jgi:hypothetical protein